MLILRKKRDVRKACVWHAAAVANRKDRRCRCRSGSNSPPVAVVIPKKARPCDDVVIAKDPIGLKVESGGLGIGRCLTELIKTGKERWEWTYRNRIRKIAELGLVESLCRHTLQIWCDGGDVVPDVELVSMIER